MLCSATVRLSVLTARIVRAERVPLPGSPFEDRATLAFVNRRLPVPSFVVKNSSEWCNISVAGGVSVALRKTQPDASARASTCDAPEVGKDAVCKGACSRAGPVRSNANQSGCCKACDANAQCGSWVPPPPTHTPPRSSRARMRRARCSPPAPELHTGRFSVGAVLLLLCGP